MVISNEAVHKVYELSKGIYLGNINTVDALAELTDAGLMVEGTARIYFAVFKCLMNGNTHSRAINEYSTDYFLRSIYSDFGKATMKLALQATAGHVTYYNALGKGRRNSIQTVVDQLSREFGVETTGAVVYPDEVSANGLTEGAAKQVLVNVYERSTHARNQCIAHYGLNCSVCECNFEKLYGDIGMGFIHVHHVVDIACIGAQYEVDAIKDLRPVCPNCHAMLHKKTPAYSIEALKALMPNRS